MAKYYKAVRPDGTDFTTGTTRPVIGEWMPGITGKLVMCKRGYHVSDAPAETLIGGFWPCRLFEVEIPRGRWKRDGHKRVVPTYRPIRELPAWQSLGPNGEVVAAFIERCRTLTLEQARQLSAAWNAAGAAAWSAAWSAAWYAAGEAARSAAGDAAGAAVGATAWSALDSALALVVRDLITPAQFDVLYGPWASVMETP